MAKKSTALAVKHALARARVARPIVIRTPTPVVKHHKKGRRGHGSARGLMNKQRMGIVAGAFIVGLLEKQGILSSLPSLPLIGRTGTIGVGAYFLSDNGKNKLADEVCTAALVIAAHELSSTGTIVGGENDMGGGVDYVAGW